MRLRGGNAVPFNPFATLSRSRRKSGVIRTAVAAVGCLWKRTSCAGRGGPEETSDDVIVAFELIARGRKDLPYPPRRPGGEDQGEGDPRMRRRPFRAGVEGLESRALLSTTTAVVPDGHFYALKGSGVGIAGTPHAIQNGSFQTVTQLSGTLKSLGTFEGQILAQFASNQYQITGGSAVFTDAAGDELLATVQGVSFAVPKHGATHTTGTYRLLIVGGTGALAGAAGSTHLDVLQNVSNGNLKFTIGGRIVTP
jgi:hypothetical protein